MAPQVGLEPTTLRLTAGCSAIELLRSVEAPWKKQGAGSELRHHIKASRYLKIAQAITLGSPFWPSSCTSVCNYCKSLRNAPTVSTFEGLTCPFGHAIKARFGSQAAQGAHCASCRAARRKLNPTRPSSALLFTSCSGSVFGTPAMRLLGRRLHRPPGD